MDTDAFIISDDETVSVVLKAKRGYTDIPATEHRGILDAGALGRAIRLLVHEKQGGYRRLTIYAQDRVDFFEFATLEGPSCSEHQLPGGGTCIFTSVTADGFAFTIRK